MKDCTPLQTRLTVAALVHWQGHFLMVEELIAGKTRFNQPAGHIEPNETLEQAVCRELYEETGLIAKPCAWLGNYLFKPADSEATYIRVAFVFELENPPSDHHPCDPDGDVLACHWWDETQLHAHQDAFRSPLVAQCLRDYQQGTRLPLAALKAFL